MDSCRIFLVRHGESTHNRDDILSGVKDDPQLTSEGVAQAETTRAKLSHIQFDEIYSSGFSRTDQTAEIIAGKPVPKDHKLAGLRERAFGHLDGMPRHHLTTLRSDPEYMSLSHEERWTHKFTQQMESDHEVARRLEKTLGEIALKNMGKTVLIATHGGPMRTILVHLGFATAQELGSQSIDNSAYVELLYDGAQFELAAMSGVNKTPTA